MQSHPIANSPTILASLREWFSSFEGLPQNVRKLHTVLPVLMNQIEPDNFPADASYELILQLMETWFSEKTQGSIPFARDWVDPLRLEDLDEFLNLLQYVMVIVV